MSENLTASDHYEPTQTARFKHVAKPTSLRILQRFIKPITPKYVKFIEKHISVRL